MVRAAVVTGIRKMEIQEFPRPKIKHDDGLLKVDMVGVCGSDPGHYNGKIKVNFPLIMGHEIVGTIDEVGDEFARIKGVKKGDRVVVETRFGCGVCEPCVTGRYRSCTSQLGYGFRVGSDTPPYLWGAYSEYLYLPPRALVHKIDPDVPLEAGALACAVLGDSVRWLQQMGGSKIGDTIVILGPGQQGLGGVIVAKECGASNIIITGKKNDKARLEMAKMLGADHTINIDEVDPIEFVQDITNGKLADIVFDCSGAIDAIESSVYMVKHHGTIVTPGVYGTGKRAALELDKIVMGEITIKGTHTHNIDSVIPAIKLIESRKYPIEKLVTHKYTLDEAEKAVLCTAGELEGEYPIKVVIEPNK